jgi:hypothetical protein
MPVEVERAPPVLIERPPPEAFMERRHIVEHSPPRPEPLEVHHHHHEKVIERSPEIHHHHEKTVIVEKPPEVLQKRIDASAYDIMS